jgi:NADPH-dependent curcumin reductase CurA
LVSAASGAVGQLVGQIAKLAGCRAVAIAGDEAKLGWCREIGFDTGINYKKASELTAAVKKACPKGVDVFFDNTGGPIHDAVMRNLSIGARVIICGRIALAAQFGKPDIGERFMGQLIVSRASVHGFLVLDWWHGRDEALRRLVEWQLAGKIRFKEDVLEGIERMPEAFLRLLYGKNFGKQIVRSTKAGTTSSVAVAPGCISRQHSLNRQRTSRNLCLSCSDSFQTYGSKPMPGHVMGKTKNGEASNGVTYPDVALTPCSR